MDSPPTASGSPSICLIGSVRLNNQPVVLSNKRLQLFTALATRAGQILTREELMDEIWQDKRPRNPLKILFCHISDLRGLKLVDISTGINKRGYVMRIDPNEVDLLVFSSNQQRIQRLLETGNLDEADRLLNVNAKLAVGSLFGDLKCGPILEAWKSTYIELLAATERGRFELRLRQGRHREVVTDLLIACQRRPHDEDLAAKLMLALYRCNRRLEVLAVYEQLSVSVREELGLDVSRWVKELHRLVLTDDEKLNDPHIQLST